MKNSFVLTSALVFILSVSTFSFFKFTQVEKVGNGLLSFTIADIPKTGTTNTNTTSKTNPDGSTTIYYPDGSTVQTPKGGGTMGTVITGSGYQGDTSGSASGDGTIRTETNPTIVTPPLGLPVEPKNPLDDKMIDPGPEAYIDPSKETNGTPSNTSDTPSTPAPNTTVSKNDSVGQTQTPTGAGSITGSAGTTPPPTNITAPTSVSFLDKLIPLNSFAKSLNSNPLDKIFNQLFFLGLIIAVVLAVIMIIRGGIEYMTTDAIAGKESGKKRVQAALGGLLLAFSAVLILNTINPGITNLKIAFPGLNVVKELNVIVKNPPPVGNSLSQPQANGWAKDEYGNTIKTQTDGTTLVSTPDGKTYTKMKDGTFREGHVTAEGTPINNSSAPVPGGGKSEEEVREYFKQNGIGINHDVPCNPPDIDGVKNGCTNVRGLGEAAMRGLVNLKNASGASVEITGGTENGHATHGISKPIVDLRKNSTLDSYITNNAVTNYPRAGYTEYKHADGTTYMNEGDHWHTEYK